MPLAVSIQPATRIGFLLVAHSEVIFNTHAVVIWLVHGCEYAEDAVNGILFHWQVQILD